MKEEEMSRGQKNWQKLRNIIKSKTLAHKQKEKKFNLFQKEVNMEQNIRITTYLYKHHRFKEATPQPLFTQLIHFKSQIDATGKWVWEAEEIAAYYLIHKADRYFKLLKESKAQENKQTLKILELGAGTSGLASIISTKMFNQIQQQTTIELFLTDGQKENIEFLDRNLKLNEIANSSASQLIWGDEKTEENKKCLLQIRQTFDFIIICDCLYFTQFHKQLLATIDSYLAQKGLVLLVNPSRGESMSQFLKLASEASFQHSFVQFEDQEYQKELKRVKQNQNCNPDKDIPYFIEMRRKHENNKEQ